MEDSPDGRQIVSEKFQGEIGQTSNDKGLDCENLTFVSVKCTRDFSRTSLVTSDILSKCKRFLSSIISREVHLKRRIKSN